MVFQVSCTITPKDLENHSTQSDKIGELDKREIFTHHLIDNTDDSIGSKTQFTQKHPHLFEKLKCLVNELSHHSQDGTNPGIIVSSDLFEIEYYINAIREVVSIPDTMKALEGRKNTWFHFLGNGRGLIGCLGAIAWYQNLNDYELDRTYELLSYRKSKRRGTRRVYNTNHVRSMDVLFPSTFDNYDHINRKALIFPNTPCPILYGVRGDEMDEIRKVLDYLDVEPIVGWLILISNQGSDDHLQKQNIPDIRCYTSVITKGTVTKAPWTITGGHVFIEISHGKKAILASAFEPTKTFRNTIRKLVIGDEVEVYGGVKSRCKSVEDIEKMNLRKNLEGNWVDTDFKHALCINIEKIRIYNLIKVMKKTSNPKCPFCGKGMRSMGRNMGFRCRKCHNKLDEENAVFEVVERGIDAGTLYEVDAVARRHLAKPLKRMMGCKGKPVGEIVNI